MWMCSWKPVGKWAWMCLSCFIQETCRTCPVVPHSGTVVLQKQCHVLLSECVQLPKATGAHASTEKHTFTSESQLTHWLIWRLDSVSAALSTFNTEAFLMRCLSWIKFIASQLLCISKGMSFAWRQAAALYELIACSLYMLISSWLVEHCKWEGLRCHCSFSP